MATAASETTPAGDGRTAGARLSRGRRTLVWILIVVASVLGFATILTLWVERQMLDNDEWRAASEEIIADPEVRAALSVFIVDELYDNVDVGGALGERLPTQLDPLAPTVAAALRQPAIDAVDSLLARPRLQEAWINASGVAHQKLMNVLNDETGLGISTGEGVVTLDLGELVRELGLELGVSEAALSRLPEDAGVITVMESDQLAAAQGAVRAIKVLSVWLLVLVLGLYALAVYLARGARRQALRDIGWAFVLIGLLSLVIRRLAGDYVLEALTSPTQEVSGARVWLIATSILRDIGWAAVLYGAVAVVGAVLAGPYPAAIAVRRRIAPVLNGRPGTMWAGAAVVYLLVVLWGGTNALRTWWGIALLGGLLAVGLVALRRQTLREFPLAAAGDGVISGGPEGVAVAGTAPVGDLSGPRDPVA